LALSLLSASDVPEKDKQAKNSEQCAEKKNINFQEW